MKQATLPPPRPRPHAIPEVAVETPPRADPIGTVLALIGIALTGLLLEGKKPSDIAQFGAYGVAASLLVSILADLRHGVRNLLRADLLALVALYFLTLFEFLFPQTEINLLVGPRATQDAVIACLWGFAGLAMGRHVMNLRRPQFAEILVRPVPPSWLLLIFWVSVVLGYFHMAIAVNFNIVEMVDYFMAPRFAQPWGRGRYGDWKALLVEFGMLMYLLPPIAGIVIARRRNYTALQFWPVMAAFAFTLFYGFSSGTRNIFHSYLVTFLIGYVFALQAERRREIITITTICAVALIASTILMLEFRQVGLKSYVLGKEQRYYTHEPVERTMHIDYNLHTIAQVVTTFPRQRGYLGWEVPYLAIIRPIPRALWKGKPLGLSASIEETVGANEAWTVAASFVGEAFMAGGLLAVFGAALFFGVLAGWWGQLASPRNSELGILVYASGFFAVVITMRSVFSLTTALLPTIASFFIVRWLVQKAAARAQQWTHGRAVARGHPSPRPPRRLPPP